MIDDFDDDELELDAPEIVHLMGIDPAIFTGYEQLIACVEHELAYAYEEVIKQNSDALSSLEFDSKSVRILPLYGIRPYVFGEENQEVPDNTIAFPTPKIKLEGTKYAKMLDPKHKIIDEDAGSFPQWEELEFAENPQHGQWIYYRDIDPISYERVIRCYLEAAKDGIMDAYACLSSIEDVHYCDSWNDKEYRLNLYYLLEGALQGHPGCMTHLAQYFMRHGDFLKFFEFTVIGAYKKELFSMWNLALSYLYGQYVPQSTERAIEIYNEILKMNPLPPNTRRTDKKHHDTYQLIRSVKNNLHLMTGKKTDWKKYFNLEILRMFYDAENKAFMKWGEESSEIDMIEEVRKAMAEKLENSSYRELSSLCK